MGEKKQLILGKRVFEIDVNYRMSYNLTKFRNKISKNNDWLAADKEVIEELQAFYASNQEVNTKAVLSLSPEARKFLAQESDKNADVLDDKEQIEIAKILTKIEDEKEIENLFNIEVEENGYDSLVNKLTNAVTMVFTNAKDGSSENQM